MRFFIPALLLASPDLAHSAQQPHAHPADWAVPAALLISGAMVLAAKWKAIRVRGRQ